MQNGSSRSPPQESALFEQPPYLLSGEDVAATLAVDPESGLDERIVKERQGQYGPNAVRPLHLPLAHFTVLLQCFSDLRFNRAVDRRERGQMAQDLAEANGQCNDVGPSPRPRGLPRNRLLH